MREKLVNRILRALDALARFSCSTFRRICVRVGRGVAKLPPSVVWTSSLLVLLCVHTAVLLFILYSHRLLQFATFLGCCERVWLFLFCVFLLVVVARREYRLAVLVLMIPVFGALYAIWYWWAAGGAPGCCELTANYSVNSLKEPFATFWELWSSGATGGLVLPRAEGLRLAAWHPSPQVPSAGGGFVTPCVLKGVGSIPYYRAVGFEELFYSHGDRVFRDWYSSPAARREVQERARLLAGFKQFGPWPVWRDRFGLPSADGVCETRSGTQLLTGIVRRCRLLGDRSADPTVMVYRKWRGW